MPIAISSAHSGGVGHCQTHKAGGSEARVEKKEKGDKAKHFPMPAAEFKTKVDRRITKMRAKMEAKMKEKSVPADKQKTALATFDAGATKVRAAAADAGKDGTVTKEEAKGVHDLAKQLRKGARGKGGKGSTKDCGNGHIVVSAGGSACCPCVKSSPQYNPTTCNQQKCQLGDCSACGQLVFSNQGQCKQVTANCHSCNCTRIGHGHEQFWICQ